MYVASGWIGEDRERAILPLYDAGVRQRRYRWSLFGIRDQPSVRCDAEQTAARRDGVRQGEPLRD